MAAVAVCANHFFEVRKEGFVLVGFELVFCMAIHTERIYLLPGIHNVRRSAVAARGPGFVGNVLVGLAVTACAADIGPRMEGGNVLLHVIYMTDEAAAIVGLRNGRLSGLRAVIQQ